MKALSLLPIFALISSAWIVSHWLALTLATLAALALGLALLLRHRPKWKWGLGGIAVSLTLIAAGGMLVPSSWGGWVALGAFIGLAGMIGVLFLTGAWSREAALALTALGLVGLGGLALAGVGTWLVEGVEDILSMRLRSPGWLFLLLAIPVLIALSLPRLARDEVASWITPALNLVGLAMRGAPIWVWLPLVVLMQPFILWSALRRIGQDELRPWVALGLRVLGVGFLAFALAEPYIVQTSRAMTVLFVIDRSLSIPEEPGVDALGAATDLRTARLLKFINDAVQMRGPDHARDQAGLIVFGRRPRLELPPSEVPRFNLRELPSADDGQYTDIASALKLALASFPDGTGKRIVLISDGNENLGNAEEQARLAKTLGVQIDVLPLAAGKRNTEEILVERVDAPPVIEQGARVPIRVLVRSHNPNVVVGKLTLRQITDKEGTLLLAVDDQGGLGVSTEDGVAPARGAKITRIAGNSAAARAGLEAGEVITRVDDAEVKTSTDLATALLTKKAGQRVRLTVVRNPEKVVGERVPARLRLGLNPFTFERPLTDEQRSYTYEAEFQPLRIEDEKGKVLQKGLPGDRAQNNRASTHVVARGQGRILLLENKAGEHTELVKRLVDAGRGRFKVVAEPVEVLENYRQAAKLAVFLSNFDCVILANVPADRISEEHQEALRANTHDQGCGLVMIGGPDSFGAGGWQNTPVEKALPVDCDIRSLKVQGKGGLVLIMHASEMANGNMWQKKVAKLAVERLGPTDEIGIIDFGIPACQWQVPMQEVGPNRAKILAKIDAMSPGDMPDFDPALKMAHDALIDKKKDFGARHVIIISDGDPNCTMALLPPMKADKITITTVGIATHGVNEDTKMAAIAKATGGRYYGPNTNPGTSDPKKLPAIYIKETRLVSQAFVHRKPFQPQLVYRGGPTAKLPDLPALRGFVRTTPKSSNLVELPILSPRFAEQDFPILAHWHYGLGKAVAFTSDAGKPELWCRDWVTGGGGEGVFAAFWEQVLGWVLRPVESGRLVMNTEYRDGKIRVTVEARTADGKPDTNLRLRAGLTQPIVRGGETGKRQEVRFVQKNSGQYEAEVKAEEAGSYFLTAQATRVRMVKRPGEKEARPVIEGTDSVRAGVTLPYSPEFSDLESNTPLLERLMELTGGKSYEDDAELLAEAAKNSVVFRPPVERSRSLLPFHYWLLFWAAGLLLLDVAVRRLAFSKEETAERARIAWARLRGFPLPPPRDALAVERLRARPAVLVANAQRGARRFEGQSSRDKGAWMDVSAPAATLPARAEAPTTEASAPPPAETPAGDVLEALAKRKKQVWDERKKE